MTSTPAWGTPQQPFESTAPGPDEPGAGGYFLVVEQLTGSGESAIWRPDPSPIPAGPTREHARAGAVQFARTFKPKHPFSQQSRTMYRVSEDSLIVVVEGATKTFHFRVSVAERLI
ncbi:MAG TPA: hypothetical protein VHN80_10305 [Kineosporiaceae bacterium]|jgi:hypothetical protein|nr:hypothetical protein [Kineosporiaceae bacterium]